MTNKLKFSFIFLAIVGAFVVTAADSVSAEMRSPIVGKGSVVSKRVFRTFTWGRANAHKSRIAYIKSRSRK